MTRPPLLMLHPDPFDVPDVRLVSEKLCAAIEEGERLRGARPWHLQHSDDHTIELLDRAIDALTAEAATLQRQLVDLICGESDW
jgi:hypothetical protein